MLRSSVPQPRPTVDQFFAQTLTVAGWHPRLPRTASESILTAVAHNMSARSKVYGILASKAAAMMQSSGVDECYDVCMDDCADEAMVE